MAERRIQVAALYRQRLTETEIARKLKVSVATISRDVHAVLDEWRAGYLADAGAAVARELAELDAMERDCVIQLARTHEAIWILRRLQVKERRAKLLGLDAPSKIDLAVYVRERAAELGLDPDEAERRVRGGLRLVS